MKKFFAKLLSLAMIMSLASSFFVFSSTQNIIVQPVYAALPATWYVDPLGIDADGHGTAPGASAFKTIQYAVNHVAGNDTVDVAAGTYHENVLINSKANLTIAGVGDTTIVEPASGIGFAITDSSDITINNLKIHTTGTDAHGIWVSGTNTDNLAVQNTTIIVDGYSSGIYGGEVNPARTGWLIGGGVGLGNHITINSGTGVTGDGLDLYDVSDSEVSYNDITLTNPTDSTNVLWFSELSDLNDLVFSHNTVSGSSGSEVAIVTDFINTPPDTSIATVTIEGNTFSNWGSRAIRVGTANGAGAVTGITINSNTFQMNKDAEVIGGTAAASATGTGNTFNVSSPAKIQKAIDSAFDGDTINVAAGTYNESVTVDKALTLLGAKSDVDPRAGAWTDDMTIISAGDGNNGILISASGVTVNGFKITGSGVDAEVFKGESAIYAYNAATELEDIAIKYNWIDSNYGSGIIVRYANAPVVEYNYVSNNGNWTDWTAWLGGDGGVTGGWAAAGIGGQELTDGSFSYNESFHNVTYGMYFGGQKEGLVANPISGTLISHNDLHNNGTHGLELYGYYDPPLSHDVTIEGNNIHDNDCDGIKITDFINTIVNDNQFTDNGSVGDVGSVVGPNPENKYRYGALVSAYYASTGTQFTGNTFSGDELGGIYVLSSLGGADLSGITADGNKFIEGGAKSGITNTTTSLIDAVSNWWGDATGPYHSTNLTGSGNSVTDHVDFKPWYTNVGMTTKSDITAIGSFDFTSPAVTGTVNNTLHTVALTVPYGTVVTALVPTITITGASVNPASGAANDFTTPKTYTVTSADGLATQDYTVTVTIADDIAAPAGGSLTLMTVNHPAPGITVATPTAGVYTITPYLTGTDVFTSLSVVVTDDHLDTDDVPVYIDGGPANGNMHYASGVWNYVPGTPVVFTEGVHNLTATFSDNSENTTLLTVRFTTDKTAPSLTVTGFTADGSDMPGDLTDGYTLDTDNVASHEYLIQFKAGTSADETLKPDYFGLTLKSSTVSADVLKAYYDTRGTPEPFLTYLKGAVDGDNPFVYINGATTKLVDAARHDILAGADTDMAVPGDYPLGTYVVEGKIKDPAGNETTVTYTLIVAGDRVAPAGGSLTLMTVNHPAPGITVATPTAGVYTITPYLTGTDVFTSLSVVVTDDHLDTDDVPVYIDGGPANGNMHYASGVWNYVPGTPVVFTEGVHNLTATFSDDAGNTTLLTVRFTTDKTAPTVTKLGDDSADVTIAATATATLTFSEALSAAGKTAVQNAILAGADQTVTFGWDDSGVLTITGHATNLTTFANDVIVASISDLAGNTSANLLLIDSKLADSQTAPDEDGNATVDNDTPQVVITNPTQAVTVTVASGTTNATTVDVGSLVTGGTGTIPQITIHSGNGDVAIPAATTVTSADPAWNGVIAAPTVTTVTVPNTAAETMTTSMAVEIGFAGAKLSFSKAVRILLPGQANKRVGYVRPGIGFTEITAVCTPDDSQTTGDHLAVDGDCKINSDANLAVWTKHFTTFATFTSTSVIAACNNGLDDDGDGLIDMADPNCSSPLDTSEAYESTGGGGGGGGGGGQTNTNSNTTTSTISSNISGTITGNQTYSRPIQLGTGMITKTADGTSAVLTDGNTTITIKPNSQSTINMTIPSGTTVTSTADWNGKIEPPLIKSVTMINLAGEEIAGSENKLQRSEVTIIIKAGANTPLTFSNPVTINIPVDLPDGAVVNVYTSNDGDVWTSEGTAVVQNGVAVYTTTHLTYFALGKAEEKSLKSAAPAEVAKAIVHFMDIAGHWAQSYINKIAELGIVNGKTSTAFAPDDNITRAELIKIAVNAFGYEVPASVTEKPAADVPVGAWYAPYVQAARDAGIIYDMQNSFGPDVPATRAFAVTVLVKAGGYTDVETNYQTNYAGKEGWTYVFFPDVPIGQWYSPYIAYLRDNNIINGYGNGLFGPANNITRAEISKIVVKMLDME